MEIPVGITIVVSFCSGKTLKEFMNLVPVAVLVDLSQIGEKLVWILKFNIGCWERAFFMIMVMENKILPEPKRWTSGKKNRFRFGFGFLEQPEEGMVFYANFPKRLAQIPTSH